MDLEKLGVEEHIFDYGGMGLKAGIYRYPEKIMSTSLYLQYTAKPSSDTQAYLVKAVQTDGHMAWASPVFITGKIEN